MLRLSGVIAGYGGGDVLQGVNLEIAQGAIACIVGPNGAGKSTALRTVSGLLRPREGSLTLDGIELHRLNCAQILAASRTSRRPTRCSRTSACARTCSWARTSCGATRRG